MYHIQACGYTGISVIRFRLHIVQFSFLLSLNLSFIFVFVFFINTIAAVAMFLILCFFSLLILLFIPLLSLYILLCLLFFISLKTWRFEMKMENPTPVFCMAKMIATGTSNYVAITSITASSSKYTCIRRGSNRS